MITQTLALFLDAYRELNAKRLFWVVLLLSLVIVAAMASVGIDEKGITFLKWSFDAPLFNTKVLTKAVFYKLFFLSLGFSIWLSWAATILALVSTSSIIPDFIAGGAVEMLLSRPIGRLRLFLTKYFTGLLFVALQVIVFSVGCFLVLGLRAGSWEPKMFLAIPLVLLFFSYLFSCCALFGLITRSTIAALVLTSLLWCFIFLIHLGETGIVLQLKVRQDDKVAALERRIEQRRTAVENQEKKLKEEGVAIEPAPEVKEGEEVPERPAGLAKLDRDRERLADSQRRLAEATKDQKTLRIVHSAFFAAKTVLPKTAETMDLLKRSLTSMSDLRGFRDAANNGNTIDLGDDEDNPRSQQRVAEKVEEIQRARSVGWVIGTSLVFEAIVLGVACWIFCRRDF